VGPRGRGPGVIDVRPAVAGDWPAVSRLFDAIHRPGHPLRSERFWRWQLVDDPSAGVSVLAVDGDEVVGHLGVLLGGGRAWTTSLHLVPAARGRGVLRRMYDEARRLGPLAATNSNAAARELHRKQGWIAHPDLQRWTAVRSGRAPGEALAAATFDRTGWGPRPSARYFAQPGLDAATLPDGSTAVLAERVGGARIVHLVDAEAVLDACWRAGAGWVDYVTSANDPVLGALPATGWTGNDDQPIPWLLDPVEPGSRADLSLMSEGPLPADLVVTRDLSDHGRVGSLEPAGPPAAEEA